MKMSSTVPATFPFRWARGRAVVWECSHEVMPTEKLHLHLARGGHLVTSATGRWRWHNHYHEVSLRPWLQMRHHWSASSTPSPPHRPHLISQGWTWPLWCSLPALSGLPRSLIRNRQSPSLFQQCSLYRNPQNLLRPSRPIDGPWTQSRHHHGCSLPEVTVMGRTTCPPASSWIFRSCRCPKFLRRLMQLSVMRSTRTVKRSAMTTWSLMMMIRWHSLPA
mmetsp:Transcript_27992/g.46517  ORF Transcript_27992/g.46517 Transcript_27992/m.46517 type:complete len:220 (-) Transcript_27992:232-891(-)